MSEPNVTLHSSFREAATSDGGPLHRVKIDREEVKKLLEADELFLRCDTEFKGSQFLAGQLFSVARIGLKEMNELIREDWRQGIKSEQPAG